MASGAPAVQPLVELRGISKRYGELLANDRIDLAIEPGEIHALLGENGAGKSTLVKILYGVVEPTAGEILWQGRPVTIGSPVQARALGLGMVFQHFSLFDVVKNGHVKIPIHSRVPLAQVAEAHRALESRETTGATVFIP